MLPYLSHIDVLEQLEAPCCEIRPDIPRIKSKRPWLAIGFESGGQLRRAIIPAWIVQNGSLNVGEQENAALGADFADLAQSAVHGFPGQIIRDSFANPTSRS
jgi:hypothetical protein